MTQEPQKQSRKFPFTRRAVEALPAQDPASPSRELEVSDAECIGLHLRVSRNGRRFYQHRYRFNGRKKCLTIGEHSSALGPQEARVLVAKQRAMLANDLDPAAEREQPQEHTFSTFASELYLPEAKQRKISYKDDVWKVNKLLNPALGHLRLSAITPRDVVQLHAKEKARTSATTANHLLSTLKRMLNLAVKWGYLEKNPAVGQEMYREPPPRERYLHASVELPRFLKALDEEDRLSVSAIRLLLYTGCRRNEVCSLTWPQVKLDEGRLFLPTTKNGRSRSVYLNSKAAEVLTELAARRDDDPLTRNSEYVFPSRTGTKRGYIFDLRKPFNRACERAGISRTGTGTFRVHDMRHTFASLLIASGVNLTSVKELLGHSDIAMTQRYSHVAAADLRAATQNVAHVFEQAAS